MDIAKRVVLRVCGIGIGIALSGVILAGVFEWHRVPATPKGRDRRAVTAEFVTLSVTAGETGIVTFDYRIRNNTSLDYRIPQGTKIMSSDASGTLSDAHTLSVTNELFVPAAKAVDYKVDVAYKDIFDRVADADKRTDTEYLNQTLQGLGGFVVFDDRNELEIDLPAGWKK